MHERGPHARVQAIGADHDGAALHPAAHETHRDLAPVMVERRALGAEMDGIRAERAPQHGLKPGTVDEDRAERRSVPGAGA